MYILLQFSEGLCACSVWEITYLGVLAQILVLLIFGVQKAMTMKNAVLRDVTQRNLTEMLLPFVRT